MLWRSIVRVVKFLRERESFISIRVDLTFSVAGNGIQMQLRAWCKSADYWDTYFNLLDRAEEAFTAKGIVVPFNQLDVHMK